MSSEVVSGEFMSKLLLRVSAIEKDVDSDNNVGEVYFVCFLFFV